MRGELASTADRELLLDALGALVFWRLIALNRPVSAEHLDQIADAAATSGSPRLASTARSAVDAVRRGVVAADRMD